MDSTSMDRSSLENKNHDANMATNARVTPDRSTPPTELKFLMFSDPAESKTTRNKKLVRSHVARTYHAKSRFARASQRAAQSQVQSQHLSHRLASPLLPADQDKQDDRAVSERTSHSPSPFLPFRAIWPIPSPCGIKYQLPALVRQLSRWEHFLVDHYATVLIPSRHAPCNHPQHTIDLEYYKTGMTKYWVAFSLTDIGLIYGLCLSACRNLAKLDVGSREMYEERALQYKGECLRLMRRYIVEEGSAISDEMISMSVRLSFDEYISGNLQMSKRHLVACKELVELRGGPHRLGLNGFLAQLIQWFEEELEEMCLQSNWHVGRE